MYPAALMRISGFEIYFSILGTSTRIGLSGFITFFEHFRVKGLIFDLFCNTIKMLFFTFGQSQSPIPLSEIRISRRDGTKNYSGMVHLVQNPVQQSEVVRINASEFFKKVYPYLNNQKNQGVFVTNCFIAAGSTVFSLPRLKTKQTSDNLEYQRMLYKGGRQITTDMKASFPDPFPLDSLSEFFADNIREDRLRDVMTAFAIPVSADSDRLLLSKSLASQFQLLIQSESNDVDDIVALKYQQLLLEPDTQPVKQLTPLYPGDSAWVLECKPQRSYSVHCYDKFQHTWVIRNNGTQTWRGRKFVFANCNEVRPRADINSIDIPDTPPGKDIKITTGFDARGSEGKFDCVWEMQDRNGENCFPNDMRKFNISINIKFKAD